MRNLERFSGNVISKADMKRIQGGITCTSNYEFRDGSKMTISGGCSSSSISECLTYAGNQVRDLAMLDPNISSVTTECV